MKLLRDEGIGFQTFVDACMQAFMRADPSIMNVINDWKQLSEVPKEYQDLYTLSHRERMAIQQELDKIKTEGDIDPRKEADDKEASEEA